MQHKLSVVMVLMLACCFAAFTAGPASAVSLSNGEYEVVVAIDPAIAYDANMVNNIETMMTDASSYLHGALRQQAIFGKVIILVPDSWPDDPSYAASEGATVAGADIFIGADIDCGACASPGRIQIDDNRMNGKTVVHEWGHYRFGLGDEYCDYVYKDSAWYQVYKTSAGWNRCTALQEIERDCDERDMSGASCNTTKNNVNGAKASIMHRQANAGIDSFCDDSTDNKYEHNSDVNNHQNRIWSSQSTWSVIEAHADGFEYTGGTTITDTAPEFEVKKASKADIVLVIDVSGSMDSFERIDNAARAAKNFVDRTEQDSYIAVVSFDDEASTEKELTEITDDASRTSIKDEIPTDDSGGTTSIGAGMQKAKGLLDASTHNLNKVMVLITDGEENEDPRIATVLPTVVAANIKVYAVGLGAASDTQLQDIAEQTGGVYYFADDGDIQALNEAYTDASNRIASTIVNSVAGETKTISDGETDTFNALIDDSLGQNTIFTFSGPADGFADISVTLKQPDNSNYPNFTRDDALGTIIFRIDGVAQTGTWMATVSNNSGSSKPITMEVTSARAPDETGVSLFTSLSDNSVTYPKPVAIYAMLSGSESIIGANVWAEITPPSGTPVPIQLSDDGQGADAFQLDGTYSGYFTQYSGNGRYGVRVYADNVSLAAQLGQQFNDAAGLQSDVEAALAYPGNIFVKDPAGNIARLMSNPVAEVGFNFERIASTGAFELAGFVAADNIPPAKITTLSVVDIGQNPPAIVLGWIATGDDMENGTATSYDLRYSSSPITDANFNSANLILGLNPPNPAGEEEQYTVLSLDCNTKYYFAIKAKDDADNQSELSNVIIGEIVDFTPPEIISLAVDPTQLWPPNHKMKPVNIIDLEVFDNCDANVPCRIVSVVSNEPINGLGDGDTAPDWEITGALSANLRAERSGNGNGREYTITVECTDDAGNSSADTVTVTVPHDKKK